MVDVAAASDEGPCHVSGTVKCPDGTPASECRVAAFDCDLAGQPIKLGEKPSDTVGAYDISYSTAQLDERGKTAADLIVKVFDADGELLATSPLIPSAGEATVVHLQIDRAAVVQSEYDCLLAAIRPRLRGTSLTDLTADSVAYLAAVTDQDAKNIARLADSARCARDLSAGGGGELPESVIYAWLSQGLPATASELILQPRARLTQALERAQAANIVAAPQASDIQRLQAASADLARRSTTLRTPSANDTAWTEAVANLVWHRRVARELSPSTEGQALSAVDLFGATTQMDPAATTADTPLLSEEQQRIVAELLADAEAERKVDPESLRVLGFEPVEIALTLRLLALAELTKDHLSLVRALHGIAAIDAKRPDGSLAYLSRLQTDDWLRLVDLEGAPQAIDGTAEVGCKEAYAASMEQSVESTFRTAVLAARIAQNRIAVPEQGRSDLITFFANNPDFEFGKHPVLAQLGREAAARLDGVADAQALKHNLLALERTLKLTDNHRQHNALLIGGLDSAHKMVRIGQRDVLQRLGTHPDVGNEAAASIFARAEHATAVATTLLMAYRDAGISLPVMQPTGFASQASAEGSQAALRQVPDLATLFGTLDSCACDPCQSVLSPSAYFVDIMKYLEDRQVAMAVTRPTTNEKPYSVSLGESTADVHVIGTYSVLHATNHEIVIAIDGIVGGTNVEMDRGRFFGTVRVPVGDHVLRVTLRPLAGSVGASTSVERAVEVILVHTNGIRIRHPFDNTGVVIPWGNSQVDVQVDGVFDLAANAPFDIVLEVDRVAVAEAQHGPNQNSFSGMVGVGEGNHLLGAKLRSPPGAMGTVLSQNSVQLVIDTELVVNHPEVNLVTQLPAGRTTIAIPIDGEYSLPSQAAVEILVSVDGGATQQLDLDGLSYAGTIDVALGSHVLTVVKTVERQVVRSIDRDVEVEPSDPPLSFALGDSPLAVLLARRPDLAEIELSCENSDILISYLDLVLEILESEAGLPFPQRIDLAAGEVAGVAQALDAGRVTTALSGSIKTLAPPLSTGASVEVIAAGKQWTVKDAARRVGILKQNDALMLAWYAPQTSAQADPQGAQPEHFNVSAYAALQSAVYPVGLPFDLWTEDARSHLAHLGVPRHALMQSFYCGEGWEQPELGGPGIRQWRAAAERFGLSDLDVKLISGTQKGAVSAKGADHGPWNFWGIDRGKWPTALTEHVAFLLQQSGLTFDELQQLLDMRFVNARSDGKPVLRIQLDTRVLDDTHQTVSCDLSNAKLVRTGPEFAGDKAGVLQRMHRFVRLWRKTGWPMIDVDRALLLSTAAPDLSGRYAVYGTVTDPQGGAVVGLSLQAVDQDFAQRYNELGRTTTDRQGRYRIEFTAEAFSRSDREVGGPDLSVRALDDQGKIFGKSRRHRSSARTLALNLTVDLGAKTVAEQRQPGDVAQTAGEELLSAIDWTRTYLTERLQMPELFQDSSRLDTTRYIDFVAPGRPRAASPYENIYLRKGLTAPPSVFELKASGREIRGAGKPSGPYVSHIASACGVSVADAQRLIDDGQAQLSLSALSRMYFSARAARVAGLSIWEFIELRKLGSEIVPFQGLASAESVVSDAAKALAGVGMPAAQAIWLLTHRSERDESDAERQKIVALLTDIRGSLANIAAEPRLSPDTLDSDGSLVRLAMQRLTWDSGVITETMTVLSSAGTIDTTGPEPDPRLDILSRHLCTFSVIDHGAPLDAAVAATFEIPLSLNQRCYYDRATRRLHFIGSMTEADHAMLAGLSLDAGYVRAVATLRDVRTNRPTSAEIFLDPAGLVELAAMDNGPTRFNFLLPFLTANERRSSTKAAIVTRLASAFSFESRTVQSLIEEWLSSAKSGRDPGIKALEDFLDPAFVSSPAELAVSEAQFPHTYRSCVRLAKIRALAQGLALSDTALAWLFSPDARVNIWLDPGTLPARGDGEASASLAGLLRLVNLVRLNRSIPGGERTLDAVYTLASGADSPRDALIGKLAELTGWNRTDLQTLLGPQGFNLGTAEALRHALAGDWLLLRLVECFGVMKRLGATAGQCLRWANRAIGPDEASEIHSVVRARHSNASWADVAKPMRDTLREKQRQALVSHLVARQGLRDSKDLYSHYLIDVEMSACAMTSRIKQACSSVQLFVQRCLLNLEPDVPPSSIDTQLWSWMKNYRVWEANRRIFLYPENWLDPELRDDKTPCFREFESALLQDDVDTRHAEFALKGFMASVNEIAQLDIRAMCVEKDKAGTASVVHLFGRTRGTPHQYFHRSCDQRTWIWSEWKRIELNIESDFIMPVWHRGRLFLYWPNFVVRTEEPSGPNEKPKRFQEVSMASSVFADGLWSPKSVSRPTLRTKPDVQPPWPNVFLFDCTAMTDPDQGNLVVEIGVKTKAFFDYPNETRLEGTFLAESDSGEVSIRVADNGYEVNGDLDSGLILFRDFTHWQRKEGTLTLTGEALPVFWFPLYLRDDENVPQVTLANTERFKLVVDWQQRFVSTAAPMLFQDSTAAFLISPIPAGDWGKLLKFEPNCHVTLPGIRDTLRSEGLAAFYSIPNQKGGSWKVRFKKYGPSDSVFIRQIDVVDFGLAGSYATYNWEMFFHTALYIATSLGRNQRFEDAKRWFEYIFDPTSDSAEPSPKRFWRFLPFHDARQPPAIGNLLERLANNDPDLISAVADWRAHPFEPHRVARLRPSAYQWSVVMKYLDNLIAWADQLFRRDTIESINEATQLYMLAAEILGSRPRRIDTSSSGRAPRTFNQLSDELDAFSNVLVKLESIVPSGRVVPNTGSGAALPTLYGLYFCVPANDALLGYWDTVEDRLFKIRHCMNLQGVVRQLPLYEPPLDPGLLARAMVAGVDLASALQDQASPLPPYRFGVMVQKALELCNELKVLGGALLSTLEKRDAEQLALLRTTQETALLNMIEAVKQRQIDEAMAQRDALRTSRESAVAKFIHYEKLLGVAAPTAPKVGDVIPLTQAPAGARIEDSSGTKLVRTEVEEAANLALSNDQQQAAGIAEMLANYLRLIPDFSIDAKPAGVGTGTVFGGSFIGTAASMYASVFRTAAAQFGYQATRAGKQAGFVLRENDWVNQRNLAAFEIMQIDKQAIASDIRGDIATKELANHHKQIDNSQAIEAFMREKYTSQDLYASMAGQISSVYFQCYQIAYDLAKRAERTFQRELGLERTNFIQFGYWDSLKKGLLAGEQMSMDIRRMEASYHDRNKREFEVTKHISLRRLAPEQFIALRTTGTCEFHVPEWLFDLDGPGHFMRRLKAVSLSVPCVTGPYTGVHCKLTLLGSQVRTRSVPADPYQRKSAGDDSRFADYLGAVESMVTSSATNDSGLFETNLRDERYLPFEGSGAIASWRLELPRPTLSQFDYATISDVILHLRYTARDGGDKLRIAAEESAASALRSPGVVLVFIRQEFPSEWARALADPATNRIRLVLSRDMLPYVLASTAKRRSVMVFNGTRDNTGEPVGFVPLDGDVGLTSIESAIELGTLRQFEVATGGFEPLLLVELGGI